MIALVKRTAMLGKLQNRIEIRCRKISKSKRAAPSHTLLQFRRYGQSFATSTLPLAPTPP